MTDVAGERIRLAAEGLHIEHRETWGSTYSYTSTKPVIRPAKCLFLHVAVVNDPTSQSVESERQVMRNIEAIGVSRFPLTGISYNAACFDSGRLYEGQPLTRRGAHTLNDKELLTCPTHGGSLTSSPAWNLNYNARAMVLPQNVGDDVTPAQIDSIARWGAALIRAGEVAKGAIWHGHRDVAFKDCPGDTGYAAIPKIQALTNHYVTVGLTQVEPMKEETEKPRMILWRVSETGQIWAPELAWHIPNESVLNALLASELSMTPTAVQTELDKPDDGLLKNRITSVSQATLNSALSTLTSGAQYNDLKARAADVTALAEHVVDLLADLALPVVPAVDVTALATALRPLLGDLTDAETAKVAIAVANEFARRQVE
jgi:hypothetical protein